MRIVNFGSCNLDYVYRLHHIVQVGETEQSRQMEVFPGGKGLNQSIAIAKAGGEVFHAGCIGVDGARLREALCAEGVDLRYLKTVDAPCGHAIIQVSDRGENSIFIHAGSNGMLTEEYLHEVLEQFAPGDWLVLQNETNLVPQIIAAAHARGLQTVFNPSPIDATLDLVDFGQISLLVLNEIEGERLSGQSDPMQILSLLHRRYPEMKLLLTLGEKGCYYREGDRQYYHPAYEVEPVDTTAAGDTFLGYFVAGMAAGTPIPELLRRACAASGIAVSRKGASPSIPTLAEVEAMLPEMQPKNGDGKDPDGKLREQLEQYLQADLKNASLGGFAASLGYSKAYAGQKIAKVTGRSFGGCLQEARCREAARLLRESDLPVGEIIVSLGYSNESFFRKKFAEQYGVTPCAYRNSMTYPKKQA